MRRPGDVAIAAILDEVRLDAPRRERAVADPGQERRCRELRVLARLQRRLERRIERTGAAEKNRLERRIERTGAATGDVAIAASLDQVRLDAPRRDRAVADPVAAGKTGVVAKFG